MAVHPNHLERGLKMMWDRPEEMAECSFSKQIEYSSKNSNKNAPKLKESWNILTPFQSTKEDEYISGITIQHKGSPFKYNDSSSVTKRSSNNQQPHASFLLFSIFTDFVEQQPRIRNDPTWNLLTHMRKTSWQQYKGILLVHNTKVFPKTHTNSNEHDNRVEYLHHQGLLCKL